MWVGPTLLYSTATSVMMLGWDGIARPLIRIGTPNAGKGSTLPDESDKYKIRRMNLPHVIFFSFLKFDIESFCLEPALGMLG